MNISKKMYPLTIAKIICVTTTVLVTYRNKHVLLLMCLQVDWAHQGSSTDTGSDCSRNRAWPVVG